MDEAESQKSEEARAPTAVPRPVPAGRGFSLLSLFTLYKPNQGKRIRLWSGIGAGVLILGGCLWMLPKLQVTFSGQREWMAAAVTLGVFLVVALLVWYLIGVSRKSVDFLIATESEMKKVTWSSRKEVWGATKVVIGMVIFMSLGLFVVDIGFTWFFTKIGVLKTPF